MIIPYNGHVPKIGSGVFIAPTAVVLGQVEIGAGASIWYGAVLRGDHGRIFVGRGSNVQDNAVIHAPEHGETIIQDDVTVGHGAVLEGCVVERGALIGMNAVVLHGATVGAQSMIAAGSVVTEKTIIPAGMLAAGVPAKVKKELSGSSAEWVGMAAAKYRDLAREHLNAWKQSGGSERSPQ